MSDKTTKKKSVGRPRKSDDRSFWTLGLEPEEDEKLQKLLKDKDVSARHFFRYLIRDYFKANNL